MNPLRTHFYRYLCLLLFPILLAGCVTSQQASNMGEREDSSMDNPEEQITFAEAERPKAYSIERETPWPYRRALRQGTRTESGAPGSNYWQQRSDQSIDVELLPDEKRLVGSNTITYTNNSPDTLSNLVLELTQNLHKPGVARKENVEITGGMQIHAITVRGDSVKPAQNYQQANSGYLISGTRMFVKPSEPVMPGEQVTLKADWSFQIPQAGASGRMGYSRDNLFFIAYWYPKMMVYDDVYGWFTDSFLGSAEFYHEFGNYDVSITVPDQWLVASTGTLQNAREVLQPNIYDRYQKAGESDEIVRVVGTEDFGNITKSGSDGSVTWNFNAENVRDFAFSVTQESIWEAARTSVGDRDGDGSEDYARVGAIYRGEASNWKDGAKHAQHSIEFLSEYTSVSYPWPHMTAVEGGGIIGGGMEFPMITLIGSYNWAQNSDPLYNVIVHEFAHMWVPMTLSSNERRYSWMDEGTTTFNENQARKDYFPDHSNPELNEFQSYSRIAGSFLEGPIMRWSDYHYPGPGFGVASYPKPGSVLVALRELLGEETFMEGYHTFMQRWKFKHPYPWDLFNTFEDVSGQDLDWFWRSWYYETWVLDQAVASVSSAGNGSEIVIEDRGQIPMPVSVEITLRDGTTITRSIDVQTWLDGAVQTTLSVDNPSPVTKVVIDPDKNFPDVNRSNNSWQRK